MDTHTTYFGGSKEIRLQPTPGQGALANSNLPPTLISSEFSGVLTEKPRLVAKVYKMAAENEIKEAVNALRPLRRKLEKMFSLKRKWERP